MSFFFVNWMASHPNRQNKSWQYKQTTDMLKFDMFSCCVFMILSVKFSVFCCDDMVLMLYDNQNRYFKPKPYIFLTQTEMFLSLNLTKNSWKLSQCLLKVIVRVFWCGAVWALIPFKCIICSRWPSALPLLGRAACKTSREAEHCTAK